MPGTGTAAVHVNLVGNDKGRVETHAELTDQVRIFFLVAGEVFHEVGSAGLGDRTQVGDHVIAVHADTVVFEGDGVGVFVEAHTDFKLGTALQQIWLGQCFKT